MSTPRWYWTFLIINAVGGAASPLLPLFISYLGGQEWDVGLLSFAAGFVGVVASLIWGKLADLTGRRRLFVLLSFGGQAACYAILPLASGVNFVIVLNVFISLFSLASASISVLLIMEHFREADWEKEIGRFNVYTGLGWTGGLVLGAAWTSMMLPLVGEGWGFRSLGALIALLAAVATGLAFVWLRERPIPLSEKPARNFRAVVGNFFYEQLRAGPAHLYQILSPKAIFNFLQGKTEFGPDLVLCYYGALLASMGFNIFFVPLPLFLRTGLGWQTGLVYAGFYVVHHLMSVFAFNRAYRRVAQWGHRPTLAFALIIRAAAFALFGFVGQWLPTWTVPVMALATGIGWSFYQLSITGIVSRLAPVGIKGQALGTFNALSGLGSALGALMGGFLAQRFGFTGAALAAAVLVILALPILIVEGRPIQPTAQPQATERRSTGQPTPENNR